MDGFEWQRLGGKALPRNTLKNESGAEELFSVRLFWTIRFCLTFCFVSWRAGDSFILMFQPLATRSFCRKMNWFEWGADLFL